MKISKIILNRIKHFKPYEIKKASLSDSKCDNIRELNSKEVQLISGAPEVQNDPE